MALPRIVYAVNYFLIILNDTTGFNAFLKYSGGGNRKAVGVAKSNIINELVVLNNSRLRRKSDTNGRSTEMASTEVRILIYGCEAHRLTFHLPLRFFTLPK